MHHSNLSLFYFTGCICPGYPGRSSGGGPTSYAVFVFFVFVFFPFLFTLSPFSILFSILSLLPFFYYLVEFGKFFFCFLHIVLVCVK